MEQVQKFPFNKNPYPIIFCDITGKCDMKCNICYTRNQKIEDLDVDFLEEAISQFPKKGVYIIFMGGEPAISPNIFDYIEVINKHGHIPMLSTNGKRTSQDKDFVKKLAYYYHNEELRIHMDMSGGLNPELYREISGDPKVLDYKIETLNNLREFGISGITIAGVLVRGLNEEVIDDLFSVAKNWSDVVYEIFFRPQFPIGSYLPQDKPYTTNEFLNILLRKKLFNKRDLSRTLTSGWLHEKCAGKNCCFRFVKDKLSVGFVEVFSQSCWQRGRLTNGIPYLEDFYEASKRDCK